LELGVEGRRNDEEEVIKCQLGSFVPCGVGILTQTWSAVISHSRKRGVMWDVMGPE